MMKFGRGQGFTRTTNYGQYELWRGIKGEGKRTARITVIKEGTGLIWICWFMTTRLLKLMLRRAHGLANLQCFGITVYCCVKIPSVAGLVTRYTKCGHIIMRIR